MNLKWKLLFSQRQRMSMRFPQIPSPSIVTCTHLIDALSSVYSIESVLRDSQIMETPTWFLGFLGFLGSGLLAYSSFNGHHCAGGESPSILADETGMVSCQARHCIVRSGTNISCQVWSVKCNVHTRAVEIGEYHVGSEWYFLGGDGQSSPINHASGIWGGPFLFQEGSLS